MSKSYRVLWRNENNEKQYFFGFSSNGKAIFSKSIDEAYVYTEDEKERMLKDILKLKKAPYYKDASCEETAD